jgi:hypothetical protein
VPRSPPVDAETFSALPPTAARLLAKGGNSEMIYSSPVR